jgi:hypothetical protein
MTVQNEKQSRDRFEVRRAKGERRERENFTGTKGEVREDPGLDTVGIVVSCETRGE